MLPDGLLGKLPREGTWLANRSSREVRLRAARYGGQPSHLIVSEGWAQQDSNLRPPGS
jgi:hypothetical protein